MDALWWEHSRFTHKMDKCNKFTMFRMRIENMDTSWWSHVGPLFPLCRCCFDLSLSAKWCISVAWYTHTLCRSKINMAKCEKKTTRPQMWNERLVSHDDGDYCAMCVPVVRVSLPSIGSNTLRVCLCVCVCASSMGKMKSGSQRNWLHLATISP